MWVKEQSEKAGLEINIQQTKITATGPITSWQIDGKTMETVADFIFLGSKVTATAAVKLKDIPEKKSFDKLRQCTKKVRHHFSDKSQYIFTLVMYICESCTIKKAEHPRMMLLNRGAGEDS